MRILMGLVLGLLVGLLVLLGSLAGWFEWCPDALEAVHTPALLLTDLLVHGEQARSSLFPVTVMAQWLLVGAAFGFVMHLRHAFSRKGQPGAAPNGGPTERLRHSVVGAGPPSVS